MEPNNSNSDQIPSGEDDVDIKKLLGLFVALIAAGGAALYYWLRPKSDDHPHQNAPPDSAPFYGEDMQKEAKVEHPLREYAVSLVVPAQEFELISALQERGGKSSPIDGWLASQLKNKSHGIWYGAVDENDHNFALIENIVNRTEQKSYHSSLDFVICLFYLTGRIPDLEAGTIGRRYDGILALAGKVRKMLISPQLSPDELKGISFIQI